MSRNSYKWAATGDINAFFGLMLDNIAGLLLAVGMLSAVFEFPVDFALRYMVPGTAIGVLIGDLLFFWLAFVYARRSGNYHVTAMPLGLDTPSTIGMVLFVLGPAYTAALQSLQSQDGAIAGPHLEFAAATQAWHIGICAVFVSGFIKLLLAFGSNWIRQSIPRAGLLGSLAAIALVLIAFTQMPRIAVNPVVGMASLVIVLITLIGRNKLPFRIPGALGAVAAGCAIWYSIIGIDAVSGTHWAPRVAHATTVVWFPTQWLSAFGFQWMGAMGEMMHYLPYIIPFAVATVIGGIDCAESAASVGDEFGTNNVIGIEAIATILAAICGGVIQTTPYIGHPAYKAMGGRAAYTLATALFVGGAGVIGYFGLLFNWIPEAAVLPILVFIGVEITAQSFHVTPRRHYVALAIACIPAMAKLVMIYLGQYLEFVDFDAAIAAGTLKDYQGLFLESQILHLNVLAAGFIVTSLIWGAATAHIIDREFFAASICMAVAGILVLFGVIHSPLAGEKMFLPRQLNDSAMFDQHASRVVIQFAVSYLVMSLLLFGIGHWVKSDPQEIESDDVIKAMAT